MADSDNPAAHPVCCGHRMDRVYGDSRCAPAIGSLQSLYTQGFMDDSIGWDGKSHLITSRRQHEELMRQNKVRPHEQTDSERYRYKHRKDLP